MHGQIRWQSLGLLLKVQNLWNASSVGGIRAYKFCLHRYTVTPLAFNGAALHRYTVTPLALTVQGQGGPEAP